MTSFLKILSLFLITGLVVFIAAYIYNGPRKTTSVQTSAGKEDNTGQPIKNSEITLPILMYHYIRNFQDPNDKIGTDLSVSPDNFNQQMAYLAKQGWQTVSLEDLANYFESGKTINPKSVIITFDDGYADAYQNALPLLEKYKFKATFFIITGKVEKPGYLSWSQIAELAKAGMEIGSHSVSHLDLSKLDTDKARVEIYNSKITLEEKLNLKITAFCYPSGAFDDETIQLVKNAGYQTAVTTVNSKEQTKENIYKLKRIRVAGSESIASFEKSILLE
ncbi:MAG: polysaccharide deacetylase [Candidatus Nealsonbacteria bacterium CG23_combo_of_CG06-09_8_20_14_all_40_13]|uniref:Polysaccharide deacetylase n=1 Tax=Candidatus Nealsonbacteria bacterium CG23_combo_of_CG06-09_8_20_14_all_40_13 TaxID=1974724 RepID=A0A2G9YQI2_9BACT|nr:MAG: polysaccharide deacetylase [Candidatus Nealsonbacteria bacterium CG23_combo_of_CG06-09_8_20_14_all_40_13]PIR71324.1 MAG: polysaccharide deacetylase [Candidatus Nealsonbacteria bacterium CG10_big_fil_rev_8_21_14_0_10_40_24]PIU43027.1 MAG: polysaccharide deacetylase [Candidatus Nealsonbacteria bacterium CG07_land_8_20_14_0_80_40_10]